MFRRQLAAITLGRQQALRYADQCIVCLVMLHRCKIGLVGGDQWYALVVGQMDQKETNSARRSAAVPCRCSST